MSITDALYLVTFYTRDLMAVTALGASLLLLVLGFFHASRGLALRNALTSVGVLALVAGTALCTVQMERAFFLTRLSAIEALVTSVAVWLFSVLLQGYYGK